MKTRPSVPLRLLLSMLLLLGIDWIQAAPTFEVAGHFSAASNPQAGMDLATDGKLNLFGTTKSGGTYAKGSVYMVAADGTLSTPISFSGSNGKTPLAGLVLHSDGNFYGTMSGTSGFGTLFKLTQSGTLTKLVVLTGTDGANPGDTPAGTMVTGTDGNLYGVTSAGGDSNQGTIFKLTTSGGGVSYSVIKNFEGEDGATPLFHPVQAADGCLYGTTSKGGAYNFGTVYKIDLSGNFTKLVDFSAISGQIPNGGLIQGRDGLLYGSSSNVANTQGTVFRVTTSGSMSTLYTFIGTLNMVPAGGVVQGSDGNFYGVTPNGGTIGYGTLYKITPQGAMSVIHSFSGIASDANPSYPLTLAHDGNIYGVSVANLFRIRFGPKPISANATPVSYSSATVYGSVNPNGQTTTAYFEYAPEDPSLTGAFVAKASPSKSGTLAFTASADLKKLFSSTTYYYRMKAVNLSGTQYGVVKSFVTKPFGEPTTAIDLHGDNATLRATINPNGQPTRVSFRYGIDPYLSGSAVPVLISGSETALTSGISIGSGLNDLSVQKTVGKLLPQTLYYYRVETVDPVYGTQIGTTHSFTTRVMGKFNGFVTNAAPTGIYSGYISVNLTSSQSMTGVLYFGGARYSLSGTFSSAGTFSQTIVRSPLANIKVTLSVDPSNHQLKGTVVEGAVTSQIIAGQLLYDAKVAKAPQAGKYTLLLPANPVYSGTGYPQGTGYLSVSVSTGGQVSIAGKLGDGSGLVANGVMVSGSIFPFYAGLYGSNSSVYRGSVSGSITFHAPDSPTCEGALVWYKERQPTAVFYPEGFSVSSSAIGTAFWVLGSGTNAMTGSTIPTQAQITFGDAGIAGFSKIITLNPNNSVTVQPASADLLKLKIAPTTGMVTGSFFDTGTGKTRGFSGIILQYQNSAGGYFIGTNQSGYFEIGPVVH